MDNTSAGTTNFEISKTSVNWIAYRVIKYNNCEPDDIIGYFQTKDKAEIARYEYVKKHNLTLGGRCCNNSKDCVVEEIEIQ